MGNTYEVSAWVLMEGTTIYKYIQKYSGESLEEALDVMKQLKTAGVGCVKLEWRGNGEN